MTKIKKKNQILVKKLMQLSSI